MRERLSALFPFLRNLAGFCLGLAVTSAVVYALDPHLPLPVTQALEERAECQVLIAGPSYVNSGIKPRFFDQESARIGLNLRSCKLAQAALHGFELQHDFDLVFKHHEWPKLEYVIVDITLGDGIDLPHENWFKPRLVDWHVGGAIPSILRYYARRPGDWLDKAPTLWAHTEHLAMNYLAIGRGMATLNSVRLLDRLGEEEIVEQSAPGQHEAIDFQGPGYGAALARLTRDKARLQASRATGSDAWPRALRDQLRGYGYEPIFLISPVLYSKRPPRSEGPGDPVRVLDFQDPSRYPELFKQDVRGHTSHLQGEGPRLYSTLLARRLLELKERHVRGRWRSR